MRPHFKRYSLLLVALLALPASAEIISPDRRIDWNPGIPRGIPDYPVGANVRDHGAAGDGVCDDTKAFQNAMAVAKNGSAVLVPAGTYRLTATLKIDKAIVLRGEGYLSTKLHFELNGRGDCISIQGARGSEQLRVTGGHTKGSRRITVENGPALKAGDFIEIRQDNDPAVFKTGRTAASRHWDKAATGQILRVKSAQGNLLETDTPLYYSYNAAMRPRATKIAMIQRVGVEHLYLKRVRYAEDGSNIVISRAAFCWVRAVYSALGARCHVGLSRSYRCEVRDSVFDDAHVHDNGGQGYGVSIAGRASDNLVENNIFNRLRHSMIIQSGATGNVYGYNYSRNTYWTGGGWMLANDISVHGHHGYMNLFEGNTLQRAVIDNVWGTSGTTTLFRNRIEKNLGEIDQKARRPDRASLIFVDQNNYGHNIIGNEVGIEGGGPADLPIEVHPSVQGTTTVHGNYIHREKKVQWAPRLDRTLPASLYLKKKPPFLGNKPWPVLGGDLAPNENRIPAQERFYENGFVVPGVGFKIAAYAVPPAVQGLSYRHRLTAGGGRKPFAWRVASGKLPEGFHLSTKGILSGSASIPAAEYPFTAEARDANGATASAKLNLQITSDDSVNLANGSTHVDDSGNFGGLARISGLWDGDIGGSEASSPGNENIDSFWAEYDLGSVFRLKKVRLFGDATGTWISKSFRVEAKESKNESYSDLVPMKGCLGDRWFEEIVSAEARFLRLTVNGDIEKHRTQVREFEVYGALAGTPTAGFKVEAFPLPTAARGLPYRHQLHAAYGKPPYSMRVAGGRLPKGMNLSPAGLISGNSTEPEGDYSFAVEALGADGEIASAEFILTILSEDSVNLANGSTHMDDSASFSPDNPVRGLWDGDTSGNEIGSPGNENIDTFWVEYDLGSVFRLKKVRLFGDSVGTWGNKSFRVEGKLSQDGPYSTLVDQRECFGNRWYEQAVSARARFVRLTLTGDTDLHRTQAREFEVLGVLAE